MNKIVTVTLPDIGEGVMEGEVIEWLKKEGDLLKQDEPVVVVMTDKATVELPALHPGKLVKHYHHPGEIATRDNPLYAIELTQSISTREEEEHKKTIEKNVIEKQEKKSRVLKKQQPGIHALAAPHTRKFAKDMEIDINQVSGTGKKGRVTVADLKRFRGTHETAPIVALSGDQKEPINGVRGLMAKNMTASKREIPHFSYFEKVDATRLIQLRHHFKVEGKKEGIHVTYMPFFIRALSLSLKQFPMVNSSIDTTAHQLILHQQHNIGIAITTRLGLIVPVLKNVQEMTLPEIVRAFETLKEKASAGTLQSQEMKESTISISNYGVLGGGGVWATPIINYPEVAILAVNKIQKQSTVKNHQLTICDQLNLSWSFDHRVIDGDLAAKFSHHFAILIQNPVALL